MIDAIRMNAAFLLQICYNPNSYQQNFRTVPEEWDLSKEEIEAVESIRCVEDLNLRGYHWTAQEHQMAKVKGTLHQCYREWSSLGAEERKQCFAPLIRELEVHLPVTTQNKNRLKVLVPGCGLGRLVLELCSRGYATQGNEFDYFMLLTCNLMLNGSDRENIFRIAPWVEKRCNVFARADLLRPITFPDVCPADLIQKNPGYDMSMCAGEFLHVYGDHVESWDALVACFFLDTAPNIFDYLELIYRMLKPGGILTSIGPLMYHWSNGSARTDPRYGESIELSYDELRHAIESYGFRFVHEERCVCKYSVRPNSMLETRYNAVQFTVQKPARS